MTEDKILLNTDPALLIIKLCLVLILLYGQTRNPVVLDFSACKYTHQFHHHLGLWVKSFGLKISMFTEEKLSYLNCLKVHLFFHLV